MKKECFQALKSLRSNSNIFITKLDKVSGFVVMDTSDCILKLVKILYDTTKFKLIGPSCDFDNTAEVKSKIQRQLQQLKKVCQKHSSLRRLNIGSSIRSVTCHVDQSNAKSATCHVDQSNAKHGCNRAKKSKIRNNDAA